jgi:hypothetical protein
MKRTPAWIVVLLVIFTSSSPAHAAGPKIPLDHKLTAYTKDASSVTAEYSLHISNPGNTPLTDLTLSLRALPPFILNAEPLHLDYLGPHQSIALRLKVLTPMLLNEDRFARIPLSWNVNYRDAEGKEINFPATSRPGGAR